MKQKIPFSPTLLACATLAFMGSYTASASAAQEAENVERIEVTGSRIKRSDMEGPSPVQSISRADIDNMGYDNLQQLLEKMPAAGNGTFSTRGNNQDSTANGSAAVSLRGLGADATLVLINGRRVAISAFAESITNSFVDINSIPVSAIERIDILKDGASAIYGSDAVAGVVNVILKKDIDGLEVNLGYGGTDGPNYEETTASLVWGTTSDKSSASVIVDYYKNTTLSSNEMGSLGTANQAPYGGQDFRSSRGFPGTFDVNGTQMADPNCPADQISSSNSCVFDYGPFGYITPASERVGAISQFEYNFDTGITAFMELAVQHNSSVAQGAPTPLDKDAGLTVPANHPNNPFGQQVGINFFRTVDAGARQWDIESDTLRFVAGLKGEINDWSWETAVQKGRSKSLQTGDRTQGWVRTDFLQ
ncbi:TonB-dependent receptor plug domain-containing protein, partial [Pseudoalteromonas sp. AOP7-A1-14]